MNNEAYTLPLSELLAESLRNGKLDSFGSGSPHAKALLPLLESLGWHNFARDLIESLPHFSDDFDIIELRNTLATLGYESQVSHCQPHQISREVYPCLFEDKTGNVLVLLNKERDKITYYDCITGITKTEARKFAKGECYTFTRIEGSDHYKLESNQTWSSALIHRFKSLITHLLMMSFLINLVALSIPLSVMLIYDKVIGSRSDDTLPYILTGIGIVLFVDFGLRQLRAKLLGTIAGRIDYLIGVETFKQLLYIPPIYTERSSVAAQLSRLKQFDSVRDFLTGNGASVILEIPFAILSIIVIALIAGPIAWAPVIAILVYILLGFVVVPILSQKQQQYGIAKSNKQRHTLQTLDGRVEIKSIGAESIWKERFREQCGQNATAGYNSALAGAIATAAGQFIMGCTALAVIAWGTLLVINQSLTVGGLIASMALIWRILMPLQMAYLNASKTQQILKSLAQINQLMKINVEQTGAQAGRLIPHVKGRILVDRLSFKYSAEQDPAVLGASFHVEPGELITITGMTGSGKSTLLKLIAGMYQAQAGTIAIDNLDIRQLDAAELRRNMAYVPQEVKMFHGTVAQNLRLNNGLATEEDLMAALNEAGIAEDVLALPKGLNTRIGDNVTEQFPPGFVRGMALARALVRPAPILLLDEPGTSMDMESDQRFIEQLKRMHGRYTVIMVTHRPSHIRISDRTVLMEHGVVKFVGDPEKVVNYLLGNK